MTKKPPSDAGTMSLAEPQNVSPSVNVTCPFVPNDASVFKLGAANDHDPKLTDASIDAAVPDWP